MRQNFRDGRRRGRHVMLVVFPNQGSNRRRNLRLDHRRNVTPLPRGRCIRPDDREPDVVGPLLVHAMLLPVHEPTAPPVVARDDERRASPVARHGLHGVPELSHVLVERVRAPQHEVIASGVGPVVGLAVSHEHDPRMGARQLLEQRDLHELVV